MKKIILILLCCFPVYCFAQNWAENNAVWYYEQQDFAEFIIDYYKYSKVGDTLLLGDSAIIMKEEYFSMDYTRSDTFMMMSDSNRVYLYAPSASMFKLVYDFNAMTGDTIQVYCGNWGFLIDSDSTINVVVDSVSYMDINGNHLKVQHVSISLQRMMSIQ
jgi:hypothetical protein